MESNPKVLDTSVLLAWIQGEPGGERIEQYLQENCVISAVNLVEFATKLIDLGYTEPASIAATFSSTGATVIPLDEEQAMDAALLRQVTRKKGLSLGDRACLALARHLNAEVLTADGAWLELSLDIRITHIRATS